MPARSTHVRKGDTQDIGWRLRQLRGRRGLSLQEVAERCGKHASQISRLERKGARKGQPKQATIMQLLDALDATPAERSAVFHIESPPLTHEEIAAQVSKAEDEYGTSRVPIVLLDEHWYRRYINPSARAILGLSPDEYERSVGSNGLTQLVDPSAPLYHRYANSSRRELFSMWAAAFRFHYADQQFDRWYLDIESEISKVFWALQIWESPPFVPEFVDCQRVQIINPTVGVLEVRVQLNKLLKAPRFAIGELNPADDKTARKLAELLRSAGLGC